MMEQGVLVYKKEYRSKKFKIAIRSSNPDILDQYFVNKKFDRKFYASFLNTPKLKENYKKVKSICLDYDICFNGGTELQLISLTVNSNLIDAELFKVLISAYLIPVVFKIVLKEGLVKTKCYFVYDKDTNAAYITDWGKEVIFDYNGVDANVIWMNILNVIRKEGREIRF